MHRIGCNAIHNGMRYASLVMPASARIARRPLAWPPPRVASAAALFQGAA